MFKPYLADLVGAPASALTVFQQIEAYFEGLEATLSLTINWEALAVTIAPLLFSGNFAGIIPAILANAAVIFGSTAKAATDGIAANPAPAFRVVA